MREDGQRLIRFASTGVSLGTSSLALDG